MLLRRPVVLLGVALASGFMILGWTAPWFTIALKDAALGHDIDVGGADVAPAILILALAGFAVIGVLLLSGKTLRLLLSIALVLIGLGAVVVTGLAVSHPDVALGNAIAETSGIGGIDATTIAAISSVTAWPLLTVVGGVLLCGLGIISALTGEPQGSAGRRFQRRSTTVAEGHTRSSVSDWDALSVGDDPTDR